MKEDSKTDPKIARQRSAQGPEVGSLHGLSGPTFSSESKSSVPAADLTVMARRLIAEEQRSGNSPDSLGRAAFRVCEKLRQPLSSLIGAVGFHALLSRALALTKREVPWLAGLQVGVDGLLTLSSEMQAQLEGDDAARGGTALIAQIHGLLITFIGEALTLRLVHNVWPKAAAIESDSMENSHEKTV